MAITLTQGELSAALRLGDSPEETAESARLLTYVTEAISRHLGDAYATAPEAIVNEAAIRLGADLFVRPTECRTGAFTYANAGPKFAALGLSLLPFRVHRAGSTDDAVAAAQEAVGTSVNPVIDVSVDHCERARSTC